MSKVLIITNHSYMLYRFRLGLIESIGKEHEVVLTMPFVGHEEDFQALGYKCIPYTMDRRSVNPFKDFQLFLYFLRLLRQESPDLVLTYSIKPNVYAGLACQLLGIPYFSHVQGLGTAFQTPVMAKIATVLYKLGLRKAKTVFFENQSNADTFFQYKILSPERACLLPGAGINLDAYPYQPYPQDGQIHFLYLGRIMKEKGVEELFDAIRRLHDKYGNQVVLDLVGFFEDSYKEQVEQMVADGVAVFHGFQQDPLPFYSAAHCVVLPSYHEGMSNVLLEAAAIGRPLITSDIPGCREAVEHGKTGLLCQPADAEDLYTQMETFLYLDPSQREAIGRLGHEKMRREFDRQHVVSRTMEALFGTKE